MRIFSLIVVLLSIAIVIPSEAQMKRRKIKRNNKRISTFIGFKNTFGKYKRYNSLEFSINTQNYLGDIAPKAKWGSTNLKYTRPGFTASWAHRFGPRYTLRAGLSYGRLQSDDYNVADPNGESSRYRWIRNASFRNDIWELQAVAIFDLFKNEGTALNRVDLTPYVLVGAALFHHNPKALAPEEMVLRTDGPVSLPEGGTWVALQPLGTEGQYADLDPTDANYGNEPYSLWQFAIPIGIGVRYRLTDQLDISVDFTFKWLFTDYIDDVSKNYVDLGVLESDLARAMSNRSRDATSAFGDPRDVTGWPTNTYTGRDNVEYEVISGFGQEQFSNKRGGSSINDVYYVTSFRIAYVLGAKWRRAKFR
jgi:hypothetical protein